MKLQVVLHKDTFKFCIYKQVLQCLLYASRLYYKFTIQLRMYDIINEVLVELSILGEIDFP